MREPGELGWRPPPRLRLGLALCFGLALLLAAGLTFFRAGRNDLDAGVPAASQRHVETAGLALIAGLIVFSTMTALAHIAARRRWTRLENELKAEIAVLRRRLDRAELSPPWNRRPSSPGAVPIASPTSTAI